MKGLPRASRVGRIAKWLRQQTNPLVTELHLETENGGDGEKPDRVATWARDKNFDPDTVAQDIEDMLSSIVTEQESKVTARLVWVTESGKPWTTFPLKLEPEGGAQIFDGTQKSQTIQSQRHHEAMAMTYAQATEKILHRGDTMHQIYTDTLKALTRLIESRENRSADLETEIARLRDENAQLSAQAMQTETVAEQAIEAAEQAEAEIKARKESEGTDGQMLKLLSKVAGDLAKPA